jgi:hypothetical protein
MSLAYRQGYADALPAFKTRGLVNFRSSIEAPPMVRRSATRAAASQASASISMSSNRIAGSVIGAGGLLLKASVPSR